jgi:uncharacterized protein (TIGR02996 family)
MPRTPADKRLDPPIPALVPERDALLGGIVDADPADDLPFLVYADWQEEHGQPLHAALIRVMCAIARSREQDEPPRLLDPKLVARMKELLRTPALKPLGEMQDYRAKLARGFLRDLFIPVRPRVRRGPVHDRRICGPPDHLDLPSLIPFDKVAFLGLTLPHTLERPLTAALAAQLWLRRVTHLEYLGSRVRPGDLRPLADSPHLGGLRVVTFPCSTIDADELAGLVLAPSATTLRAVHLSGNCSVSAPATRRPSEAAVAAALEQIGSSPLASRLTSLEVDTYLMGDEAAAALLRSPHLTGLKRFKYNASRVSPMLREALAERFPGGGQA